LVLSFFGFSVALFIRLYIVFRFFLFEMVLKMQKLLYFPGNRNILLLGNYRFFMCYLLYSPYFWCVRFPRFCVLRTCMCFPGLLFCYFMRSVVWILSWRHVLRHRVLVDCIKYHIVHNCDLILLRFYTHTHKFAKMYMCAPFLVTSICNISMMSSMGPMECPLSNRCLRNLIYFLRFWSL
jgi:hypothetical protein